MGNEVTKKTETAIAPRAVSPLNVLGSRFNIEPAKLMEVLRGTVIKPDKNGKAATNEEVAAFCVVAAQYDLNPFTREIYAFASGEKGVTVIVPIDGWCKIVNRHKNADGELDFDGCEFEEVNDASGNIVSTTCRMFVKGRAHPVEATEYYEECKRNTTPWQMKRRMLRHKSYMQAARYAFGLGGIHDEDEARDITADVRVSDARAPVAMPVERQLDKPADVAQEPETDDGAPIDNNPY
jgi:phage recombination protein Bet